MRNLKNNLAARNRSVLAHGTDSIKPDLSRQLGDLALRSVRVFWGMECGGESVDERIAALAFVSEA